MVMTSDGTQIQILANWPMSHAKRVTRDNWKNPEYHVGALAFFFFFLADQNSCRSYVGASGEKHSYKKRVELKVTKSDLRHVG